MKPLYKRLLGKNYELLPPAVQRLHEVRSNEVWHGRFTARRGRNPLCRFLASLLALPTEGKDRPLSVTFTPEDGKEHWLRDFNGHRFYSLQWERDGRLHERLRLVTLVFEVQADAQALRLQLLDVHIFGLSVNFMKPSVSAVESERDGIFHVDVEVRLPLLGLLVEYHCRLRHDDTRTS